MPTNLINGKKILNHLGFILLSFLLVFVSFTISGCAFGDTSGDDIDAVHNAPIVPGTESPVSSIIQIASNDDFHGFKELKTVFPPSILKAAVLIYDVNTNNSQPIFGPFVNLYGTTGYFATFNTEETSYAGYTYQADKLNSTTKLSDNIFPLATKNDSSLLYVGTPAGETIKGIYGGSFDTAGSAARLYEIPAGWDIPYGRGKVSPDGTKLAFVERNGGNEATATICRIRVLDLDAADPNSTAATIDSYTGSASQYLSIRSFFWDKDSTRLVYDFVDYSSATSFSTYKAAYSAISSPAPVDITADTVTNTRAHLISWNPYTAILYDYDHDSATNRQFRKLAADGSAFQAIAEPQPIASSKIFLDNLGNAFQVDNDSGVNPVLLVE